MDKKNTLIGMALLLVGFGLMMYSGQQERPAPRQDTPSYAPQAAPGNAPAGTPQSQPTYTSPPAIDLGPAVVEANGEREGEIIVPLSNGLIEASFTNYGGDIKEITLKDFEATKDSGEPYVMNRYRYAPALSISKLAGAGKDAVYELIDYGGSDTVAFRKQIDERLEITRIYRVSQDRSGAAPYSITHEIILRNLSDQPIASGDLALNIGTVAPSGSQDNFLLTFGYSDGEDIDFIARSKFEGGGFLGFFESAPRDFIGETRRVQWVSVKNQFFIAILTPSVPGSGYLTRPVEFPPSEGENKPRTGITADLNVASVTIPANGTQTLQFNYYAGPKEHKRLSKLENNEEKAMQFGFFGPISKGLLLLMNSLYGMVGNYGIAIILLTLVVRVVFLPLNLISSRSMKRMSKLAEPMKLLKEKFPDNQQKQQQAMMELYRLNKVNPVAGCLPMLAQIPIFFALFYMLRGAAELRFAEFLWIGDLSKADTIASIFGLPLNILPFIWLVSMVYQMWTMPTPSVDNAQVKIMKFIPFIFFPITYMFASGLVLYWTISNVFTIGQQYMINRKEDNFEVVLPPALKKAMESGQKKGKKSKKTK